MLILDQFTQLKDVVVLALAIYCEKNDLDYEKINSKYEDLKTILK